MSDDRIDGYRRAGGNVPVVESIGLRYVDGTQKPTVRHGSPAERQILRDQIRQGIEMITLARQNTGRDLIVSAHRQGPMANLQLVAARQVGLLRVARGQDAVRRMYRPVFVPMPGSPADIDQQYRLDHGMA